MAIQVLKATEEDFPSLHTIHVDAFKDSPVNRVVSPKGDTPGKRETNIEKFHRHTKDPSTNFIKAVDTESGEIAGFARWNIYPTGRTEEELNTPKPPRPENPEMNVELMGIVVNLLEKTRRETMGQRPHCSLNLLAVSPKFQRRGVGALLVQYGTDIADRNNMESYLESTKPGYILYRRAGFEDTSVVNLDLSKWSGVEGDVHSFPVMIRPAQGKGTQLN